MSIAVVTDSTSDLLPEIAREHGIEVVPNLLIIENKTYLDGAGMTRDEFYTRLPHFQHPTSTAAPSPEVYTEVYKRKLSGGADQVVSLHPASRLSALFDIATLGAKPFGDRVKVIDSDSVSMGLGFQALNAARCANAGGDMGSVTSLVDNVRKRVRIFAFFDTLVYAARSGRVNWLTASVGSMLGLRALIEIRNGVVHRLGLVRNRHKALHQLKTIVREAGKPVEAAILFTTPIKDADAAFFLDDFPKLKQPILHIPITPIVGNHVGPGCVGFGLVLE